MTPHHFIEDSLEAVIDKGSGKASEATLRTHRALVDAVATADPQRAAQAARDHAPWVERMGDSGGPENAG